MSIYPEKTISDVISKLDAKNVLTLINYRLDTIQEVDDSIKCFCPIHKETVFRTLVVHKAKKTFRCSYSLCPGNKGGDLISLFAGAIAKDYDESIPLLVKQLQIDVELPTTQEFIDKTLEVAENYLELGVFDEAEKGFRKVTEVQHSNLPAHKGLLEVYTHLADEEKASEEMRTLISILIDAQQFEDASEFCNKLLEKRPEDVEIRNALIQCYLGVDDTYSAFGEYMNLADFHEMREEFDKALEIYRKIEGLETDLVDVHPHIVQVLVALNRTQDAIDETLRRAQSFLDANDLDKALQSYRSILELDDTRNEIRLAYINAAIRMESTPEIAADCLRLVDDMLAQESFPDAVTALKNLISRNPNDADTMKKLVEVYHRQGKDDDERELRLKLAELFYSQGNLPAAIDALQQILAAAPDYSDALQRLASLYRDSSRPADAQTALLKLISVLEQQQRFADAIKTYDTLIELDPDNIDFREKQIQLHINAAELPVALDKCSKLISFFLEHNNTQSAIDKIRFALSLQPHSTQLLTQLAELLAKQHNIQEAKEAFFKAYEAFRVAQDFDQAALRLQSILDLDADDTSALSALADLYALLGETVKALKNYRRLSTLLSNRQDWNLCESVLRKILDLQPEDISTLNQLVKVYTALNQNDKLVLIYQQLISIYFKKEAYAKIIELSNATLKLFPSDLQAHQNLVTVYETTGKHSLAIEHLFQVSEIYKALNDIENEQRIYERILSKDNANIPARKRLVFLFLESGNRDRSFSEANTLVDQYLTLDNLDEAVGLLKRLLEFEPDHVPFHERLIEILKRQNKFPELLSQIKKLISIQKSANRLDAVVSLYRELLLHDSNNLDYRHQLVDTLLQIRKTDDATAEYLSIADFHIAQQNFDEAEKTYLKIIDLDSANQIVREKLVTFFVDRGALDRATEQSVALSKLRQDQGDLPNAIATLRHVLAYDPNNVHIRRSIIDLDKNLGDVEDALSEYAALFRHYQDAGDFDAAVEIQNESISYQPANPDLRRTLINAFLERGEKGPAVAQLFGLITLYSDQQQFDAAIAVADEILAIQPQNFKARKIKAEIFMLMGNEKQALLEFVQLSSALEESPAAQTLAPPSAREEPHLQILKEYTFDTFVVGEGNNFASATALAVAKAPADAYNPLFLFSDVGLGKTHLMHAIANHILQQRPDFRILYTNTEEFTTALVDAIQNNTLTSFRQRHKNTDVLLLDDVQFLAGKELAQEEFFHIFNTLHQAKKQIVVTSDRPPKDIAHLEKRLKSRFGAGVVVDIQPPGIETRIAILKREAANYHDVKIPDDLTNLIAERIETNVRDLKGALNQIVAVHRFTKEDITPDMVTQLLDRLFEKV